jgi:hypothetical protein
MGLRVMVGKAETDDSACLYDSVTMQVFGPIFYGGEEEADMFLDYLNKEHSVRDAREIHLAELMGYFAQFCEDCSDEEGNRTYPPRESK